MVRLVAVLAWVLSVASFAPAAPAQVATPGGLAAEDALPTLDITVTATAYEGIPASVEAGRYRINLTVAEDAGEFGGGVAFVQPSGMSADEFIGFLGVLASGEPPSDDAAATPAEGEEGGMMLPEFLFTSTFAGGIYAPAGETAEIVLDLTPGEWVAWGDDPASPWAPVAFEATGEMPADLPEPDSSATITMGEYVIEVTEGELVSGSQWVRIDNIGAQPHFITASTTTVPITDADMEALLHAEMTGTPAALDFDPDTDFTEAFYSGTQSTGTSIWVPVDLTAGYLAMFCFFPDIADGMPHAYHGMYKVLEVAA